MFHDERNDPATELIDAVDALARSFPAYDELEHMGCFNDALAEIADAASDGDWALLVALLRAWPPEIFGLLLDRVAASTSLVKALERIDEDTACEELSSLAETPQALLRQMTDAG